MYNNTLIIVSGFISKASIQYL